MTISAKKNHLSFIIFFVLLISNFECLSQQWTIQDRVNEYIAKYKDLAIEEMVNYNIPASIILAQAILESGTGMSSLAIKANNHFGIKCKSNWKGETVSFNDDKPDECFRKYNSIEDSYKDHSEFLTSRPRYLFLFDYAITDYKAWANGLKQAGYATHPMYSHDLISIIEEYKLYEFDRIGLILIAENRSKQLNFICEEFMINAKTIPSQTFILHTSIYNG